MEPNDKINSKYKVEYLKLSLKIAKLRNKGEKPPKMLLKQAQDLGRLAGIDEQELNIDIFEKFSVT